jgi:C1A family cysteine protease
VYPPIIINHKVKSIEKSNIIDVYDLTVEKYHNFALSSGVFAHNCIVGYNDKTTKLIIDNSWGTNWGKNGMFEMSYDDFKKVSFDWFRMII